MTRRSTRGSARAWALALLLGALATWLLHRHQFASGFDLFPGPRGDTRLIAYLCEHWYQVLHGKAQLLSPSMFYPVEGTLGYSDTLLLFALPYSGLRAVGLDVFTALAVVVVAFSLLNFLAGFALLFHGLRVGWLAAVAGATFFAFNNPKLSVPDNLQLQSVWPLAVVAGCVLVFFRDVRSLSARRAFWLLATAGLAMVLQLLTGFYLGWFLGFWGGIMLAVSLGFGEARQLYATALRLHWRPLLGASAVAAPGLLLFLAIYVPALRAVGGWAYRVGSMHVPELRSYLLMADGNVVWGGVTESLVRAAGLGPDWGRRVGVGAVATLAWLAVSLAALLTRPRRPFLVSAIVAVNVLLLLAFQYRGHSPWRVVYTLVPGGRAIRDVGRFMIVMALPISIAFALAIEAAQRWIGRRAALRAALVALIVFGAVEQFNRGEGQYFSIRAENQRLQGLAARLPAGCQAFYVTAARRPDGQVRSSESGQWMHDASLVSVMRGVPTLNGRSGKSPRGWALRDVTDPDYEARVRSWITSHKLGGRVCALEIES
jgi:hypothetical protein